MSAVAVVTSNESLRGGKIIPLRKTVSEALANNQCPTIKNIFVKDRTKNFDHLEDGDIVLSDAMKNMSTGNLVMKCFFSEGKWKCTQFLKIQKISVTQWMY